MNYLRYPQMEKTVIALAEVYVALSAAEELRTSKEVQEHAISKLWECVCKHVEFSKKISARVSELSFAANERETMERDLEGIQKCLQRGPICAKSAAMILVEVFEIALGIYDTDEE